jgi:hypothetical protein
MPPLKGGGEIKKKVSFGNKDQNISLTRATFLADLIFYKEMLFGFE